MITTELPQKLCWRHSEIIYLKCIDKHLVRGTLYVEVITVPSHFLEDESCPLELILPFCLGLMSSINAQPSRCHHAPAQAPVFQLQSEVFYITMIWSIS